MVTYLPTEHPGTRPSVWPALSAPSMSCHRSWKNIQLVGDNVSCGQESRPILSGRANPRTGPLSVI